MLKPQILVLLFVSFGLFLSSESQAQANPKFSYGLSALVGKGTMGNGQVDAPDRDMMFIPVSLYAGYNIKKFRLGLNYEYMMGNQTAEPVSVANTNLSGTGSGLGVRLEYYSGKQSFGLVYRLSSTYALEKQTFSGTSATYKGAGGISIQYTRQIKNKIGFVLDYTMETFNDSLSTGSVKWNRIGLGVVFSNFGGAR